MNNDYMATVGLDNSSLQTSLLPKTMGLKIGSRLALLFRWIGRTLAKKLRHENSTI